MDDESKLIYIYIYTIVCFIGWFGGSPILGGNLHIDVVSI